MCQVSRDVRNQNRFSLAFSDYLIHYCSRCSRASQQVPVGAFQDQSIRRTSARVGDDLVIAEAQLFVSDLATI